MYLGLQWFMIFHSSFELSIPEYSLSDNQLHEPDLKLSRFWAAVCHALVCYRQIRCHLGTIKPKITSTIVLPPIGGKRPWLSRWQLGAISHHAKADHKVVPISRWSGEVLTSQKIGKKGGYNSCSLNNCFMETDNFRANDRLRVGFTTSGFWFLKITYAMLRLADWIPIILT